MVVAIDFTGSNGNPAMPDTLHYIDPAGSLNPYQQTINSLAKVLEQYDSDKLLPSYGFGARGGAERKVSHCFPLNGDPTNPYVQGMEGLSAAYRKALTEVPPAPNRPPRCRVRQCTEPNLTGVRP